MNGTWTFPVSWVSDPSASCRSQHRVAGLCLYYSRHSWRQWHEQCACGCTALAHSPIKKPSPKGLPVDFVVRGVLEQSSYDEALDFLQTVNHAASQENYLIADEIHMATFECSQNFATEFLPFDEAPFTFHTIIL